MNKNVTTAISGRWGLFGALLIGFLLGYVVAGIETESQRLMAPGGAIEERHLGRLDFTNPLVDIGPAGETNKSLAAVRRDLEREIRLRKSTGAVTDVAVYYQGLEENDWFGIKEREAFMPASLMKVLLMVVYYKLSEYNENVLSATIINTGQVSELANLPPAQRLAMNEMYTIDALIEHMIVHSDNEATALLAAYLTEHVSQKTHDRVQSDIQQLVPFSLELEDEFLVSARDYASVFRVLYNATYLSENMSERALRLLSRSSYDSGIVSGIPDQVITSNKFGFNVNAHHHDATQLHDCGIVYAEAEPYILCIMTKTNNVPEAQATIANLSRTVFAAVGSQ